MVHGPISPNTKIISSSWEHPGLQVHQEDEGAELPVYETGQGPSTSNGAADGALGKQGSQGGSRCVDGARGELGLISEWVH